MLYLFQYETCMIISDILPQITIFASDMPAWISYVKAGLVIVSAEHSHKFSNILYMNFLQQIGADIYSKMQSHISRFSGSNLQWSKRYHQYQQKVYLGFEDEASFQDCSNFN